MNRELAQQIVDYLNDLLERDTPAIAALVANRVPCNAALADHPTCQVSMQHGGFHVGILGLLNGLCGVDDLLGGCITAVFEEDDGSGKWLSLKEFRVRDAVFGTN